MLFIYFLEIKQPVSYDAQDLNRFLKCGDVCPVMNDIFQEARKSRCWYLIFAVNDPSLEREATTFFFSKAKYAFQKEHSRMYIYIYQSKAFLCHFVRATANYII